MLEIIIIVALVAADQFTKHLVDVHLMPLGTSHPLWEGVFHFTSAHNYGAAFGMLQGARWVFLALTVVVSFCIAYGLIKYYKRLHRLLRLCLALILAGAIGNLIDRIGLGYVRDMFDFTLINFAIFNVADSAVSVGTFLLALDILFGKGKVLLAELEGGSKPVVAKEPIEAKEAEGEHGKP